MNCDSTDCSHCCIGTVRQPRAVAPVMFCNSLPFSRAVGRSRATTTTASTQVRFRCIHQMLLHFGIRSFRRADPLVWCLCICNICIQTFCSASLRRERRVPTHPPIVISAWSRPGSIHHALALLFILLSACALHVNERRRSLRAINTWRLCNQCSSVGFGTSTPTPKRFNAAPLQPRFNTRLRLGYRGA
jgi:hypothetical protein